jgi:hypothetical protein
VRRRSRDVLMIGEEQLLDVVDLGRLEEPEQITEGRPWGTPAADRHKPREPARAAAQAVEVGGVENGGAGASDINEDELVEPAASAGGDLRREPGPVGADVRGARGTRALSRSRPRLSGAAASVGIAAVLGLVTVIALETRGPQPRSPQAGPQREEPQTRAPRPEGDRGHENAPADREPSGARSGERRAARRASPPGSGALAETRPAPSPDPVATSAQAPSVAPAATPAPPAAAAQNASPVVVQQEFGP